MPTLRRATTFFNIWPGEERLIGLLVLLYFVLALAYVLVQSMAFGVFLTEYGPQGLPYAYLSIALLASLAAYGYIRLGEHVSFATSLRLNLIFLGAICFVIWLGLKSPLAHGVAFFLPLLFQVVVNLGNLVVWPLAGRLFTFQQAKRLFPLLGVGLWTANTSGGLLVTPLVARVGADNLLLLAVISIGLAFLVLYHVTRTYLRQAAPAPQPQRARSKASPRSRHAASNFLKSRYIVLIFTYVTLWWMAFFFLDNIFADRAAAQFPDADQLTAFMGQLLAVTGIVALISSTFLTGRIIGRFGLRTGLIGMPLAVTVIVGVLALSGTLGAALAIVFAVSAFAKLINGAFGFSLSQSANAIVYQALPDQQRARAQATAEGIVQPIAVGLAGLSLLFLTGGLHFGYVGVSYVFIGLAVAWLIVIVLLSRGYVQALTQAITRRRWSDAPNVLPDPTSVALLQARLSDPHPGTAIYAMNQLAALNEPVVIAALPQLIHHSAPEVRQEALRRVEARALTPARDAVREQLAIETASSVREAGWRALGAVADKPAIAQLNHALADPDRAARRGALIGLLKYAQAHQRSAAVALLDRWCASPEIADRVLAAHVIGQIASPQFASLLRNLLSDPVPAVRREALLAAGRLQQPELYPLLIEACAAPETNQAAGLGLTLCGASALPALEEALAQPAIPRQRLLTLIKVMGEIGGTRAHAVLRGRVTVLDGEVRSQTLLALSQSRYRTADQAAVRGAINAEASWAAWISGAQIDLGDETGTALLIAALHQEVRQTRDRILLWLSFIFDATAILRVRDAFLSNAPASLTYALEIIDTQLPADWKPVVLPVLEELSPHVRAQHLAPIFPREQQTRADRLCALIAGVAGQPWTAWLQACAIYTTARLSIAACQTVIHNASSSADPLINDTACWALAVFSTAGHEGSQAMLSTIEKVIILKSVNMFSRTPDNVLAEVAHLLEEVDVNAGDMIFQQGEPGDSLYVIVDGRVRVHDGERLINYLGEHDVFGEMALLDAEPRMASVSAVEPTRLFRLEHGPFFELLNERPEIATGIIRVLTQHLRNRINDLAILTARHQALENLVQPQ